MAKTKGTTVLNAVRPLRANKEAARAVLPSPLHAYLKDRILVSAWYPEEDLLAILQALARILPDPGMNIYEFMGRSAARNDLSSVYEHMLRKGDPIGTLRRGSLTWQMYHDTGAMQVVEATPTHVVVELANFALPSKEICGSVTGWIAEVAGMSGAQDVEVHETACVRMGQRACRFEGKWTMPPGG